MLISDLDQRSVELWHAEHGQDAAIVSSPRPTLGDSPFAVLPHPPADRTRVHDLDSLLVELDRIRRNGFAISDEELERGVVAVSAPVRDFTGRIVAAVNVSAPKARVEGRLDRLAGFVAKACHDLSATLGHRPE